MKWLDDDAARRRLLAEHPAAGLVSVELPLRANLTVLENIAVVEQYLGRADLQGSLDNAAALLELLGHAGCAGRRDSDLDYEERFVAKLLRALAGAPDRILVDRPGALLPDTHYPPFLQRIAAALGERLPELWILDYAWNAPLYRPS